MLVYNKNTNICLKISQGRKDKIWKNKIQKK